jgi:hypothetical protein
MINITYSPSFKAMVVFDEVFTYTHFCQKEEVPIDVVIEGAKLVMDDHNFKQADIFDANTGEILAQLLADDIDDDDSHEYVMKVLNQDGEP